MNSNGAFDGLSNRLARDLDGSFPDMVRLLQGGIFSGALQMTRNRQEAEDITQETFIRAYRALRDYDRDRIKSLQVRAWVWTIAVNLCRNLARSRSRHPVQAVAAIDGSDPVAGPEEVAVQRSMLEIWSRRLGELSEAQRTAVVLRHVVGLNYSEIAEVTGRPAGTAKADVHRGLEQLRRQLAKEESST